MELVYRFPNRRQAADAMVPFVDSPYVTDIGVCVGPDFVLIAVRTAGDKAEWARGVLSMGTDVTSQFHSLLGAIGSIGERMGKLKLQKDTDYEPKSHREKGSRHIGHKVAHLLELADIRQAELARRCRLSHATLSKIISGERKDPGIDTMISIADALGVSLDCFRDNYRLEPEAEVIAFLELYHTKEGVKRFRGYSYRRKKGK